MVSSVYNCISAACGRTYIGQTGRSPKKMAMNHNRNVRGQLVSSYFLSTYISATDVRDSGMTCLYLHED